jgi:predicted ester cyclase
VYDESEIGMDVAGRDRQVRRFVDEVWNAKNYPAAAELYGENYVNGFGSGPSAKVEPIRLYHQTFPDLHLNVEELIVATETVVLRGTFRGTDNGGYVGRRPTGRAVVEWAVTIMHSKRTRSSGNGLVPTSSVCSFSWEC